MGEVHDKYGLERAFDLSVPGARRYLVSQNYRVAQEFRAGAKKVKVWVPEQFSASGFEMTLCLRASDFEVDNSDLIAAAADLGY